MSRYEITMTSLTHILQTVMYSVDFGSIRDWGLLEDDEDTARTNFWIEVIRNKASDSGFPHLVDSMIEHGGFTPGSAIGWDEFDNRITEGHHRLVAAILLGLDEVPTTHWGSDDLMGLSAHDSFASEPSPYNDLV